MSSFICPVCENILSKHDKNYVCKFGHNYDISKKGYINLLMSQQSKSKNHGDDKLMINARRNFLKQGYYSFLMEQIVRISQKYCEKSNIFLDIGCGEGWYTTNIFSRLDNIGKTPKMLAIDISKDALDVANFKNTDVQAAVASAFSLPVSNNSCNLALSIFAPFNHSELSRVLAVNGCFIRVYPLENHLLSLKKIVYNNALKNDVVDLKIDNFELIDNFEISQTLKILNNQDLINLFAMTPYLHRSSFQDKQKLEQVQMLEIEAEFGIAVYKKEIVL